VKNAPSKEGCPKYKISQPVFVVEKPKFDNLSAAEMKTRVPKPGLNIIIYGTVE
jgi:hypothetical protein